jgi:hypothetical protein
VIISSVRPSTRAIIGLGRSSRSIASGGSVVRSPVHTDERHALLGERRDDKLPGLSVRQDVSPVVNDLEK